MKFEVKYEVLAPSATISWKRFDILKYKIRKISGVTKFQYGMALDVGP